MNQFVQSAIEAAKQGDKNKAIGFLKQVLNANPNDVDAWLVLAAVMDDPERKRQCLNRVLTLDPVNAMAREELLEMDRAAMGGTPPFTEEPSRSFAPAASVDQSPAKPAPVSKPASQPEKPYYSSGTSSFEPKPAQEQAVSVPPIARAQTASKPKPSSKTIIEKPQIFKYPLFWRIVMYFFVIVLSCVGLLMLTQSVLIGLPFLAIAFIMLVAAIAFSPTVKISDKGIRASAMLSSAETGWDEIVSMKSGASRLVLTKSNGDVVHVSNQVSNYPRIVEIIRQKRPDLFGLAVQPGMSGSQSASSTPAFTGTKTFKKGSFAQYGIILLMLPLCLFGVWAIFFLKNTFAGIGIIFVGLLFIAISLFAINQVKLEPNKLMTETFFGEKVYTAQQIKEIRMKTVRSRHGIATNFVDVQLVDGGSISMAGFPEGDEVIYGTPDQLVGDL